MSSTWMDRYPHLYAKTVEEMRAAYPDFRHFMRDGKACFAGPFELTDRYSALEPMRPFELDIELPDRFPDAFPVVREIAGRVPRTAARHVYTDGSACLSTEIDLRLRHGRSCNLVDLMRFEVRDWCIYQYCTEVGEPYPHGERAHGTAGVMQSLKDTLAVGSPAVINDFLWLLTRRQIDRRTQCPCGSGSRLRDCHGDHVNRLREVLSPRAARDLLVSLWPQQTNSQQRTATNSSSGAVHKKSRLIQPAPVFTYSNANPHCGQLQAATLVIATSTADCR